MGISYNPSIVSSGLVLCLDAANPRSYSGTGNTCYDISSTGNHGTLTNGPTYDSNNKGYFVLDGSNDYIQQTSSLSLSMNNFAMSCWFKTNTQGDQKLVSLSNSYHPLQIINNTFRTCTNGCTPGTANVVNNQWNYACVVGDATSIRVYLNGNSSPDITQATSSTTMTGIIRIGSVGAGTGSDAAGYYYNGNISQVLIYNRSLSVAEINKNFETSRSRYGV